MPFADFFEPRRSGLLALLNRIEKEDRVYLDYVNYGVMSDTRNESLPIYDLSCFAAVMGLCHANWLQAEVIVLLVSSVGLPLIRRTGRSPSYCSRLCVAACSSSYPQPKRHCQH
jgi:hypothetical protein